MCPVSCKFGQKILAAVQMQQRGSIVIKGDRLLLLMRDLRIFLDDVFLRISDEMQLHFDRIFIIFQKNYRLVNSRLKLFVFMGDIFQEQ